ncbi:hypothetical protein MTR67_034181 [Solanum verrucosum]|uniref:Disease resistance protein winged helix domain-containing protein n=1 Tax=Solanum verrucosum TaxID=315347 RepID=A0AAF0U7Y4_SOLVR|nr:hypothetical protein MTR67_034181 [Solanum verrucosum]
MHICYTNLKASTSAEIGRFINEILETSLDILREYLIHLQEHMVNVTTPSTLGDRNIHVMIEFLLLILSDIPKDFIHHDKLFDLLALVGALIKEEDLKHVYLKAPDSSQCCFPMSDRPLFMHLLHIHLNDLLDSNAYSIALIKEEIELVRLDLEFIRSFFVNVEQGFYKDLWESILDMAYEAKDVIDSIIVRDNGLIHLIFSLPVTIKKMKLIKEEVSDLHENIPKSRGFKEETNWIIRKLTSGPADLDVISITGMPGSVDQVYDEKKLLNTIFNQVSESDLKFSENIDIADKIRKQLFGKRREKKKTVWLEVVNNFHSFILKNEVDVMKGIEISYDHLPDHLKPCLLCFASFPKDRAMTIYELKSIWGAEVFEEKTEMKSMKEVVNLLLDDLIFSNLVIYSNDIGDATKCQIHDLVHDFCLIKAREERLFDLISSSAPSDLLPRQITIHDDKEHLILSCSVQIRKGILDSSFIMVKDSLLNEICMLNHLRYLRIGTEVKSLALSFSNLWNLEILSVDNKESNLILLLIAEDTKLENLRILGHLVLSYSKDTEDNYKRLPNLQVLSIELMDLWDYSTEQYWFSKLDCLTELEELIVVFESSNTNDTRLPNLEELTLYRIIIHGEEWNMGEEDTFENLKCLKLHRVTLSKREVGEKSFPALEKLKLEGCCDIEEIPPSFGDIYSLKIIKLVDSPHLEDSSMKIKEYAEDMRGGDVLQVVGRKNIPLFK